MGALVVRAICLRRRTRQYADTDSSVGIAFDSLVNVDEDGVIDQSPRTEDQIYAPVNLPSTQDAAELYAVPDLDGGKDGNYDVAPQLSTSDDVYAVPKFDNDGKKQEISYSILPRDSDNVEN